MKGLHSPKIAEAFRLLDGGASQREAARSAGIRPQTLSNAILRHRGKPVAVTAGPVGRPPSPLPLHRRCVGVLLGSEVADFPAVGPAMAGALAARQELREALIGLKCGMLDAVTAANEVRCAASQAGVRVKLTLLLLPPWTRQDVPKDVFDEIRTG